MKVEVTFFWSGSLNGPYSCILLEIATSKLVVVFGDWKWWPGASTWVQAVMSCILTFFFYHVDDIFFAFNVAMWAFSCSFHNYHVDSRIVFPKRLCQQEGKTNSYFYEGCEKLLSRAKCKSRPFHGIRPRIAQYVVQGRIFLTLDNCTESTWDNMQLHSMAEQ